MNIPTNELTKQFPARRALGRDRGEQTKFDAMAAELQASLAREQILLSDKRELAERQLMLAHEFEHRLINGLQLVVSLLSLQSRAATTPEAATQLTIAARRVSALGRVHHRLHLLDHQRTVRLKDYLSGLCVDLSGLLFEAHTGYAIVVEGEEVEIPTASAIPLSFIVNELITNSVKYAKSHIAVRIETNSAGNHSLTVSDDGPGLPDGFDHRASKGLGMKIIQSLVKQIGGGLRIMNGDHGRGAYFIVTFRSDLRA